MNASPKALQSLTFDFSSSPTAWSFLQDDAFVRGLLGPVGSGKSYTCCSEIMRRALGQRPSPRDNIRYSRWAIVRNSYPELRTTTIKTWKELFPENLWGEMRWSPPITHHIRLPVREEAAGLDCEVIFLALDQPKDVRKLLSLELTGAFVNEARELPKAVIDGLTMRVGRFPTASDGGPTWRGVIMDTNPVDSDHWWYVLAEKERITGDYPWRFYSQPGGMIEFDVGDLAPEDAEKEGAVFAAGKWWRPNPARENKRNLVKGYYEQMMIGKNLDWIRCYVGGQYTYVQEGKPVTPEYDDAMMSGDVSFDPDLPLQIGLDFGLTPAAAIGQRSVDGQWRILHEIVTFDMGLERFGQQLRADVAAKFSGAREVIVWGDPAGAKRDEIYEVTAFEYLKTIGFLARPTATNDFKTRREAMAAPMQRLVRGKPGIIVSRHCTRTRKALAGGYYFKRESIGGGQERFKDVPVKNDHSHIADAFGYLLLGGGEHRNLTRRSMSGGAAGGVIVANTDFDPFD